jgi:hypothetical protein
MNRQQLEQQVREVTVRALNAAQTHWGMDDWPGTEHWQDDGDHAVNGAARSGRGYRHVVEQTLDQCPGCSSLRREFHSKVQALREATR